MRNYIKIYLILNILFLFISSAHSKEKVIPSTSTLTGKEEVVSAEGKVKEVIQLKYAKVSTIMSMLQVMMPGIVAFANEDINAIEVYDTVEKIEEAKKLIEKSDIPTKQVIIRLQILEISRSRTRDIGLELTSWSLSLNEILPPERIQKNDLVTLLPGLINLKGEKADVKLLATPSIMVNDRQKAQIIIGDRIPIPITTSSITSGGQVISSTAIQFEEVGIKLMVTPIVRGEDEIDIELAAEVSSIGKTTKEGYPEIGTRNAMTNIHLKDGYTAIIGGLIKEEKRKTRSGIPILKDIPILGLIFGKVHYESVFTEIRLILTPLIVKEDMFKLMKEEKTEEERKREKKEKRKKEKRKKK